VQLAQLGAPLGCENAIDGIGEQHASANDQIREGHRLMCAIFRKRICMTPGFVYAAGAHRRLDRIPAKKQVIVP